MHRALTNHVARRNRATHLPTIVISCLLNVQCTHTVYSLLTIVVYNNKRIRLSILWLKHEQSPICTQICVKCTCVQQPTSIG